MHYVILKGKSSYSNSFSKPEISHQLEQDCQALPNVRHNPIFHLTNRKMRELHKT